MSTITLALYFLGQFGRVQLGSGRAFYIYEIALVIWLVKLVWKYKSLPLIQFRNSFKYTAAYFVFSLLSLVILYNWYSFAENIAAILYFLRLTTYFLWFYYFWFHIKKHLEYVKKVKKIIHFLIYGIALTGILQYFIFPDISYLMHLGWDPHLNRMFGLFLEPPIAAAIYAVVILYVMNIFPHSGQRNFLIVTYALMLVLTYSRGTFLAVGIVGAVVIIRRTHMMLSLANGKQLSKLKLRHWDSFMLVLLITGLVLVAILPQEGEGMNLFRTSTVYSRISNYEEGLRIFQENPVIGIGYNHIAAARSHTAESLYPDHAASSFQSSFLVILVTGGVIGLLLFMALLYEFMNINLFSEYAILLISTASITDNVILHPFILFFLFILVAVSSDRSSRLSGIL